MNEQQRNHRGNGNDRSPQQQGPQREPWGEKAEQHERWDERGGRALRGWLVAHIQKHSDHNPVGTVRPCNLTSWPCQQTIRSKYSFCVSTINCCRM